jgi:ribonuclease G
VAILEKCPTCGGTGEIKPSILLTDEIENNIQYLLQDQNEPYLLINLHPFVYAFLKQRGLFRSIQWKWYFKFKKWIHLTPVNAYQLTDYRFLNKNLDEIKM